MSSQPFVFETLEPRGELLTLGGSSPAARAAEIVAEAEARAAAIQTDAHARGLEAGRIAGLELAELEAAQMREALAGAISSVHEAREEFVAAAELRAVELALALAEKVVCAALAAEPALVCEVVAGALRRTVERDRLVLEVNPEDVEIVRSWLGSAPELAGGGTAEVLPERRVPRGGCVVRTTEGEIDARIPEQLGRAGELLRESFAARRRAS